MTRLSIIKTATRPYMLLDQAKYACFDGHFFTILFRVTSFDHTNANEVLFERICYALQNWSNIMI